METPLRSRLLAHRWVLFALFFDFRITGTAVGVGDGVHDLPLHVSETMSSGVNADLAYHWDVLTTSPPVEKAKGLADVCFGEIMDAAKW